MKFAVGYFPTDEGIDPITLARMVEQRPFESLFFTDHTHIPASRATPYPAGTELPREYSRIHDPFVALTAAAGATERIRLGTGVCLVVERDPIVTAKQAASLDRLSGGRLLFGVGAGWNEEEMRPTARIRGAASPSCASAWRRSRRSGPTTRRAITASTSISTASGAGRSR